MKKAFLLKKSGFVALLILVLAAAFLLSCGHKDEKVIIGAILPLSGPASFVGEELRDGLMMAAKELNENGGINGKIIDIVIENAAGDKDAPEKAFNKIMALSPLVIVTGTSSVSGVVAPLAEKNKEFMTALVATAPDLTKNREWVYRYWPTAEHEAPPMADIFQKLGKESFGIIYVDDAYGKSVFGDLCKRMKGQNVQIISSAFPLSENDFMKYARLVYSTGAVAIIGFDTHVVKILKALKEIHYSGALLSTTTGTLPTIRKNPESDGMLVSTTAIYNENYSFINEVKSRYQKLYQKEFTQYSANGYDFLKLLIGLMEDKEMSKDTVKSLFEKGFLYSGVFGNIELTAGHHDIFFPLFPARIENGKIQYR